MNARIASTAVTYALAVVVISLTCAVSFLVIRSVQQAATLQHQVDNIGELTKANASVVAQIQIERERNVRQGCMETNARHDETVAKVKTAISTPEMRKVTIGLVDALAPHRDCERYVREQVEAAAP